MRNKYNYVVMSHYGRDCKKYYFVRFKNAVSCFETFVFNSQIVGWREVRKSVFERRFEMQGGSVHTICLRSLVARPWLR